MLDSCNAMSARVEGNWERVVLAEHNLALRGATEADQTGNAWTAPPRSMLPLPVWSANFMEKLDEAVGIRVPTDL
jgi:hypothetical protein